jgi:hypothetical protein
MTMGRAGHIAHRTRTRTKPCGMPQIPACLFWNKATIGDAFICLHLQAGSWKRVGRWLSPQSKHEQPSRSTVDPKSTKHPALYDESPLAAKLSCYRFPRRKLNRLSFFQSESHGLSTEALDKGREALSHVRWWMGESPAGTCKEHWLPACFLRLEWLLSAKTCQ